MNTKVELNEMEMNQVAGGRIRIRLHGPRKNSNSQPPLQVVV